MTARTLRRATGAVLAALLVALLLPASVGATNDGGGSIGGGIGLPGGGRTGRPLSSYCQDGFGALSGRLLYDRLFHKCLLGNVGSIEQRVDECLEGFEVWRFWGTESRPVTGYSVSNVGLSTGDLLTGCRTDIRAAVFPISPFDAGVNVGSPWVAGGGLNSRLQWAVTNEAGLRTTSAPFRRYGSCGDIVTRDNPLARYFNPPSVEFSAPQGAAVRERMWALYRSWRGTYGDGTARAYLNLAPGAAGPDSLRMNSIPCDSGLDFVRPADAEQVVYGACQVPVRRASRPFNVSGRTVWNQYLLGRVPNGALGNGWPYYAPFTTAGSPQTGDAATISSWRHAINVDTYLRGSSAPSSSVHGTPGTLARCWSYRGQVAPGEDTTTAGPAATHVEVNLSGPPFAHVGGIDRTTTVTATQGRLMCDSPAGASVDCSTLGGTLLPRLNSLAFELSPSSAGGYRRCDSAGQSNCDWVQSSVSPTRAPIQQSRTLEGAFFNATSPGQEWTVSVTDASATYERQRSSSSTICLPRPPRAGPGGQPVFDGSSECFDIESAEPPEVLSLPVRVRVGGRPAPSVSMPVVSGTNCERTRGC